MPKSDPPYPPEYRQRMVEQAARRYSGGTGAVWASSSPANVTTGPRPSSSP